MPGECQILYLKITMRSVMMLFFCLATCFSTFFCSVHGMGLIGFATLKRLEEKKPLMDKIVSLFMNVLIWGEELTEWFIPRYLIFCYILDARKRRTQCKGFPAEDYYFLNFIQLKKIQNVTVHLFFPLSLVFCKTIPQGLRQTWNKRLWGIRRDDVKS